MAAKKTDAKRGTAKKAPASKLAALKSLLTGGKGKTSVAAGAKKVTVSAKVAPAKGGKTAAKAPAKAAVKSAKEASVKPAPVKGGKAAAPAPAKAAGKAAAPVVPAKGAKGAAKGAVAPAATTAPTTGKKGRAQAPVFSLRQTVREATSEAVCREVACEGLATTLGYCRLHYIKNWKKIKRKEVILKEGKLNQYIEELVAKYPDKYLEAIRQDLTNDKDFAKVIYDLDLDESVDEFDAEGENVEGIIDTIKRDFEDEGEAF